MGGGSKYLMQPQCTGVHEKIIWLVWLWNLKSSSEQSTWKMTQTTMRDSRCWGLLENVALQTPTYIYNTPQDSFHSCCHAATDSSCLVLQFLVIFTVFTDSFIPLSLLLSHGTSPMTDGIPCRVHEGYLKFVFMRFCSVEAHARPPHWIVPGGIHWEAPFPFLFLFFSSQILTVMDNVIIVDSICYPLNILI